MVIASKADELKRSGKPEIAAPRRKVKVLPTIAGRRLGLRPIKELRWTPY